MNVINLLLESVNTKREELKENIRETFDEIIDIAKKRRSELLEEVDKASLAKTTQLDMQREGLVKIKDALQLTLDTGTTVCSQYDSVELLAVKDYIQTALKSYFDEAQSAELSPVCCNDLTYVADESMLESLRNYGEIVLQTIDNHDAENEDDFEPWKWEESRTEEPMMDEPREEEPKYLRSSCVSYDLWSSEEDDEIENEQLVVDVQSLEEKSSVLEEPRVERDEWERKEKIKVPELPPNHSARYKTKNVDWSSLVETIVPQPSSE